MSQKSDKRFKEKGKYFNIIISCTGIRPVRGFIVAVNILIQGHCPVLY